MEKKILLSPAKVNIGLWVVGKRPDGYHEIYTLFHTIDLYDRIYIQPSAVQRVEITSPLVDQTENTITKTFQAFEDLTGIKPTFNVLVEKNIPVGGGLGGGSSNAATVLKFINEYYDYPLSEEELHSLARYIGADVPFFLKGGFAIGEGVGEKLTFIEKRLEEEIFIIYPNIQIPTKEVYQKVGFDMLTTKDKIPIIDSLLGDISKLFDAVENTLGSIVEESYPQVKEVLNTLRHLGYKPLISGSGSSVFALGKPTAEVEKICKIKGWKLIKTTLK
ncbi:MAG: 4-(cytidine 5'-diphospho)-2-C-methyl-D-erythritol kinase [Aquificae bacterium]|nr:4-(cytidine 5'-diphospho)-2-C-methyl-D-erythritol kinase [Aquificota bacterium]